MTFGNIVVDGYGLHPDELPNTATSGYGHGLPIGLLPPIIRVIEGRIYVDEERMMLTANRALLEMSQRELVSVGRQFAGNSRFQHRADRIYMDIDAALNTIDRVLAEQDRAMVSTDRDLR